jgi:Rne/Rng family ribonuclease
VAAPEGLSSWRIGSRTRTSPKEGKLGEVISASQSILVQIAKEPISTKGPRLTAEVTLAGRYMVLVPFINKVSISSRLTDEVERKRLKELMQAIRPEELRRDHPHQRRGPQGQRRSRSRPEEPAAALG